MKKTLRNKREKRDKKYKFSEQKEENKENKENITDININIMKNVVEKLNNEKALDEVELKHVSSSMMSFKKEWDQLSEKGLEQLKKNFFSRWFSYQMDKDRSLEWINDSDAALFFYKTDYGYRLINAVLRGSKPVNIPVSNITIKQIIKLIDDKLNKKQQGKQVFRGVRQNLL